MDALTLARIAREAGLSLYADKSYNKTRNAQQNLTGRTHYVDADTMRYFGGKILKATELDSGLLFGIVESVKAGFDDNHRVYRPVFFDIFGNVISRVDIENSYKTATTANKAFWEKANSLDAVAITREAVALKASQAKREHENMREVFNASFGE